MNGSLSIQDKLLNLPENSKAKKYTYALKTMADFKAKIIENKSIIFIFLKMIKIDKDD